jgi:hypothetical protein
VKLFLFSILALLVLQLSVGLVVRESEGKLLAGIPAKINVDAALESLGRLSSPPPNLDYDQTIAEAMGFYAENSLPPEARQVWNATILLFGTILDEYRIGTGLIIGQKNYGTNQLLFIVTTNHFAKQFCQADKRCPDLFSLQDIGFDKANGLFFKAGEHFWRTRGALVIRENPKNDLVLLSVVLPRHAVYQNPPLPIDFTNDLNTRESVMAVSYPDLTGDTNTSIIRKRWSSGVYEHTVSGFLTAGSMIHTVPVKEGSSGSPLFRVNGHVAGINYKFGPINNRSEAQSGGCSQKSEKQQAIPAAALKEFLEIIQ